MKDSWVESDMPTVTAKRSTTDEPSPRTFFRRIFKFVLRCPRSMGESKAIFYNVPTREIFQLLVNWYLTHGSIHVPSKKKIDRSNPRSQTARGQKFTRSIIQEELRKMKKLGRSTNMGLGACRPSPIFNTVCFV